MPATPAWPPRSTPRVFVDRQLAEGDTIDLDGPAAHYLGNVMRLKDDDPVRLFDDRTGEYVAVVTQARKRVLTVMIEHRTSVREQVPDFWLCVAPIKRQRFDWVAEKACELGVRRFVPVLTARAVVDKVKPERLRTHMIEAAEQCERTALPELSGMNSLSALLKDWPTDRTLFFANERCHEAADLGFASAIAANPGPAAVLVGPEGGFTDDEIAMIEACPQSVPVSLGPRILRAETAALAATAIWMATQGDWNTDIDTPATGTDAD